MDHTKIPRCQLTLRCNMSCWFCSLGLERAKYDEISGKAWLKRIRAFPSPCALITGGEPTLHRDFAAIVRGAAADRWIHIHSNFHAPWNFDLDDIAGKLLWRASCHAQTAEEAQQWVRRVTQARKRGHKLGLFTVHCPEAALAVLREHSIRVDTPQMKPQPLSGRVRCTSPIVALAPDGRRYHCLTMMMARDKRGIIPDDKEGNTIICDHALHCTACDGWRAVRVATE